MQQVSGNKLLLVKARTVDLQSIIKNNELSMQDARDTYANKRKASVSNRMTPAEFLALFPSPPTDGSFVTENAAIAATEIERTALSGLPVTNERYTKISALTQGIVDLKNIKLYSLDKYALNVTKPERTLTEAEFLQLYPLPEPGFTAQLAAIATARVEVNKLSDFLKTGPFPWPGSYDVDLLAGTAISYP